MVVSARNGDIPEEDVVPLVRSEGADSSNSNNNKGSSSSAKSRFRHRAILALVVAVLSVVVVLVVLSGEEKKGGTTAADIVHKPFSWISSNKCPRICSARVKQRNEQFGGDLLDAQHLKRATAEARERLLAKLKVQYGEYYEKLFWPDGVSLGKLGVLSANNTDTVSVDRFRRKLLMKMLKVQTAVLESEKSLSGCDCTASRDRLVRRQMQEASDEDSLPPLPDYYARMVWATGGHSAAAGHGNMFNESYTAFMESDVKEIFSAVGIEFEGRNYAMGGTPAAPEIALCSDAVFGTDADVISWDTGMMENRDYSQIALYVNRAAINPNRPALAAIHVAGKDGRDGKERVAELRKLEERGLIGIYVDWNQIGRMEDTIPDMFGMNAEQIDATPEFVRYYKCNKEIEKGEPSCGDMRYTNYTCVDRTHKAWWHPGWKAHALHGHVLGLFLADLLVEAVDELVSIEDPMEALERLQAEEDADYAHFWESPVPDSSPVPEVYLSVVDRDTLYRSPSVCHTGRLPSKTRYLGILMETDKTGMDNYETGIPQSEADGGNLDVNGKDAMPLVFNDRDHKKECNLTTYIDYKDFFYNREGAGWRSLTIPNEAERKEYVRDGWNPKGALLVCLTGCDWGKCNPNELRHEAVNDGRLKMEINRQQVINATVWSSWRDCAFLRGKQGYFWKPNQAGQFELRTLVTGGDEKVKKFARISSFIVF